MRMRKLAANGGVVGPSGVGVMVRLGGDSLGRCEVIVGPELLAEDRSRSSLFFGGGSGDIDAIAVDKLYVHSNRDLLQLSYGYIFSYIK